MTSRDDVTHDVKVSSILSFAVYIIEQRCWCHFRDFWGQEIQRNHFQDCTISAWHCDVTWWQSVKRWSYSLGNDSVEFLDLKNPENDTNNVVLWYIQQKIEYLTLWRHVWRPSRDVTVSSADRTVLEMIPLNFLTSKIPKMTPTTLFYDIYSKR